MKNSAKLLLASSVLSTCFVFSGSGTAGTVTIATVNNSDMIRMQRLSKTFEEKHPDIKLNWVVLEENVLRQRLTTDIATKGGQFDVLTIGMYEASLWGQKGWLQEMKDLPASYALDDVFPSVRDGLSVDGKLFALPFYAEASITYYRTDLFKAAGLTMPERPTWTQIAEFAGKLTDKSKEQYGLCLRGKAGWGENMALITTLANAYGGRWFDEKWTPQFDQPEWKNALNYYVNTMKQSGPPGASSNGFNENLALFNSGKCAIWVDASVAGSFVTDKKQSKVADSVGFTYAPHEVTDKGSSWLYSWSLAIPTSAKNTKDAAEFTQWATSKEYAKLVADTDGVSNVPPGTRASTYTDEYKKAAPFANVTLESLKKVDPKLPTLKPVPYVGIQLVTIPEFQAIGTSVGQQFSAALIGQATVDQALQNAQTATTRDMKRAGYPKK
ncbi:sugar ABC transporter substrate-binding protein [Pseudomonas congelans]|uniref:ABC transporter substrate-binding protein n=1 Tax=Pseudomonas congelans TaxID=200452 RepID=UPI000BB60BED|nr:sugar ABC transporter substrate-binding protein [Pseudomonas congelans]PBQ15233.1 sugar ABC transporter substrate-binding protein [Pseudomonas congelans]